MGPLAARAVRVLPRLLERLVAGGSGEAGQLRSAYWTLLEFAPFRRAFVGRVARRPADLGRVASAMRAALEAEPSRNAVRTLLAEIRLAQGRGAAAERLAAGAFRRVGFRRGGTRMADKDG